MMNSPHSANTSPTFWRSKPGIALGMLLVIVLFYLAREHYGHMLGLLPYMMTPPRWSQSSRRNLSLNQGCEQELAHAHP
ncbi:DUF2933 domain-containing protein [Pseudomonas sp. BGI-2]|uniref:DUF2933 domain-containing protein n=1 Tax=Pseudomonas sp. BGI-2 TaxID=2528211 RepID=UPI00211542BA|nr:DUF2933 domain-containing protein [Pseudomonas sp. BGI-2]